MYQETIQSIRKRCRMAMNGIASTSMRSHGLNYKLNFGVSIMQIKEIASHYDANADLAQILWKDGTRELKIIATLLYPLSDMSLDTAEQWIKEIPNQEIREQLCFNLLQHLPEAFDLAKKIAQDDTLENRASAYFLLGRLLISRKSESSKVNLADYPLVWDDVIDNNLSIKNGAKLFLQNVGKISQPYASEILSKLAFLKDATNLALREVYDSLAFEFDFYYESRSN